MAATVRNKSNPPRKGQGLQESNPPRRATAWRGPSNSSSNAFTPPSANQSPRLTPQFPPLGAQTNGPPPDTPLPPPSLIGSTIIVSTRSGQRYEGSLLSVPAAADGDASLQLKDVKDLANPSTPLKETVTLPAGCLANWSNSSSSSDTPAKLNGDFRTDTDISGSRAGTRRERELQAWQPDENSPAPPSGSAGARGDEATFGPGSNAPNGSWDQFAANEELFGVKTSFDEDLYTTKLDRSSPGFKEKARMAEALANEMKSAPTTNPHVAEERNLTFDDSSVNEEDKYAGVVRGANAYVPPARRNAQGNNVPQATKPAATSGAAPTSSDIPKVSVTESTSAASSKPTSPPAGTSSPGKQPPSDLIPTFRDFVTNEKQRLTQKRQAIVKNEMDKRMSELVKFSQNFKLNKPIPEDLVAILAKDEEKQKQIREKASRDAASAAARSIGMSHSSSAPIARPAPASPPVQPKPKPAAPAAGTKPLPTASASSTAKKDAPPARIPMVIQKIPPFNPNKVRGSNTSSAVSTIQDKDEKKDEKDKTASPASSDPASKLNANASPFKLKPNAPTFKPVAPSPPPKSKPAEPTSASYAVPNPFFGTRPLKKGAPVHVKDDFNPFKNAKVADASTVAATWPYSGKRFATPFASSPVPPAPQPMPQHIPPTGPPAAPPPSYEEDQHAAAAARGFGMVYAYAPYAYPGQPPQQPMMAGAPPSAPPGNYISTPFLQPMHYPPMPPNGHQAMYAPPPTMGTMPPPQQYMQPPPPGAYPPPPNGAGRGSMSPTPIPHAHAYAYHQSPQLSHAVPYQMMMPPPNGPPHASYENGPPPVPMGGVGHA